MLTIHKFKIIDCQNGDHKARLDDADALSTDELPTSIRYNGEDYPIAESSKVLITDEAKVKVYREDTKTWPYLGGE